MNAQTSIFQPPGATDPSTATTYTDGTPIVVGVKFTSSTPGYITKIRFYKQTLMTGTHTALLFDSLNKSTPLSQVNFTSETATGWQDVILPSSIAITANKVYVAAVLMNDPHYTASPNFFTANYNNGNNLTALSGTSAAGNGGNGMYVYTTVSTPVYPSTPSPSQANYWIDVVFNTTGLPVELTDFTGSARANDVQLNWSTASEQINKGFEVQRSGNGESWNTIGFVNGAGTTSVTQHYRFTDKGLAAGNYYYRLNQVDLDGHSKVSRTVQVAVSGQLSLQLLQNQPNPFTSGTRIDITVPQVARIKLTLIDQLGRPIRLLIDETKYPGSYRLQVERSSLPTGIYYYRLEALGQSITKKMIIL